MFTKVLGIRIETRGKRRLMVAATYASYIALVLCGSLTRGSSGVSQLVGVTGLAIAGLFTGLIPNGWTSRDCAPGRCLVVRLRRIKVRFLA